MGIRTRHKRLEHFEQRADAFDLALLEGESGVDHKRVERDKAITVGAGNHRRLMVKRIPSHLKHVQKFQNGLLAYCSSHDLKPEHYVLVPVKLSEDTGVMEYFNTPSVEELSNYLELRDSEKKRGKPFTLPEAIEAAGTFNLTRDEWFICKRFSKQNPGVNMENLDAAFMEMNSHIKKANELRLGVHRSNIVVIGQEKEGRIKLAIVDV
jgi:hypothetical protein